MYNGCLCGNKNQKDVYDDIDYDNWYSNSSNFICRAQGVQKDLVVMMKEKKEL